MEDSYEPNQYEVLRVDETASSREIAKAFLTASSFGPWEYTGDERVQVAVAQRRIEAYRVLSDPVLRATYDREQGYTKDDLARRIGHKGAEWGLAWAFLFGLLAFFFMLDHENMSRMFGVHFAPDFTERRVEVEDPDVGYRFEGEFHSTDSRWDWVLNSWLALSLGPAIVTGFLAAGGPYVLNRVAGEVISRMRSDGYRDTWVRAGFWLFAVLVPIAAWVEVARYGLGRVPYT